MEEKERYYVNKIGIDCLFPDGLWEIKDIECNKWFLVIEGRLSAYKITKKLNQQDKRIKELEQENQQLKEKLKDIKNNYRRQIDSLLIERLNLFKQLKQSQKQLAIIKLKQIICFMENSNNNHYPLPYEIKNFIENQIKDLEGIKNE